MNKKIIITVIFLISNFYVYAKCDFKFESIKAAKAPDTIFIAQIFDGRNEIGIPIIPLNANVFLKLKEASSKHQAVCLHGTKFTGPVTKLYIFGASPILD